jgi:hypothetical protein
MLRVDSKLPHADEHSAQVLAHSPADDEGRTWLWAMVAEVIQGSPMLLFPFRLLVFVTLFTATEADALCSWAWSWPVV